MISRGASDIDKGFNWYFIALLHGLLTIQFCIKEEGLVPSIMGGQRVKGSLNESVCFIACILCFVQ